MRIESRIVGRCGVSGRLGGMKLKVGIAKVGKTSVLFKDVGVERS